MKKLMLFLGLFLLMVGAVYAATVERTILDNKITINIDIETGMPDTGKYGLIIVEYLPEGYVFAGIDSQELGVLGSVVASKWDTNTRMYEAPILAYINPASFTYKISGSGDGPFSGSYILSLGVEGQEISGQITGDDCLGVCTDCVYASVCDEIGTDCAGRDTDGTVCDTNKECSNGVCVAVCVSSCTGKSCGDDDGCGGKCVVQDCGEGLTCSSDSECVDDTDYCADNKDCEFYQKCEDSECVSDMTKILLIFGAIIGGIILLKKL